LAKLKALVRNEPYLKDWVNEDGYTLPFICAAKDYVDAMELFIGENIDCMAVINSSTMFHLAAEKGSLKTLQLLLHHNSDGLNRINYYGDTCLHLSCFFGFIEVAEFLVGYDGIDVNIQNVISGDTPLHRSCYKNSIELVSMLLRNNKIDVNIRNKLGKTPLHISCKNNSIKLVLMLLNNQSIDVSIKNNEEKLPDELTTNVNIKRMIKKKRSQMAQV